MFCFVFGVFSGVRGCSRAPVFFVWVEGVSGLNGVIPLSVKVLNGSDCKKKAKYYINYI